eukprot:1443877-Pyramimonas_sp.AAC.1
MLRPNSALELGSLPARNKANVLSAAECRGLLLHCSFRKRERATPNAAHFRHHTTVPDGPEPIQRTCVGCAVAAITGMPGHAKAARPPLNLARPQQRAHT